MTIKNDKWIRFMAQKDAMIAPFEPYQVRKNGVISYGTSSFGYDMRIGNQFKVFTLNNNHQVLNPKLIHTSQYVTVDVGDKSFHIPPQSYALGYSIEHFKIPDDVVVVVIGKSTYARAGLIVNVTPGEPGWQGQWTIELFNCTPFYLEVFPNEGIAQCLFYQGERPEITYADKHGKYMNQKGITLPKVEQ